MTLETAPASERRFLRTGLPWLIAAVGLVLYLATLNHWVTFNSLPLVARVNGWDWRPMRSAPLLFLLTWPCRWLPATAVPPALNLLAAVCASLTLALLARAVALLPHDRLEQQRLLVEHPHALLSVSRAWVPMVLAAAALGLQLSFWEDATAASGEMLDLLLFAYLIRCLLEYRIDQRQAWLDRATFVCGLGIANNWFLVAFLPLFVVALLWTRRLSFFKLGFFRRVERSGWQSVSSALAADIRFLLRMALVGLAGLSLLLLVPLAQRFSPDFSVGFWQALRSVAASYKTALFTLSHVFLHSHREAALVLVAVSLLPVLLLSIRWRGFAGGKNLPRLDLVTLILYLSHAFLLLVCVWIAFDPSFSPRHIGRRIGLSLPLLSLYYLSALSIGYYSGFFLLVFSGHSRSRRILRRALDWAAPTLACVLLGLTLAGLFLKNLPAVRASNGPYLDQYAAWVAQCLPPDGAVVLADDPMRLAALQAALARGTNAGRYLLAELPALSRAGYRAHLRREHPGRWPELDFGASTAAAGRSTSRTNTLLDTAGYLQLMTRLAQSNRVFCLQPTFGVLLERFDLRPRGLVYELRPYPTNAISGPALDAADLAENATFWQRVIATGLNPILRLLAQPDRRPPGLERRLMELGHLELPPPVPARVLALCYSAALDYWGVTLQRQGGWGEAAPCFALAQQLNPDNLPARVNLQCNSNLLAGTGMTVVRSRSFQEQFGKYRNWQQVLAENGPFDEPTYCYQLALAYAEGGLLRQACQQLERVVALAPDDLYARISLGHSLIRCRLPDQALQIAAGIQVDAKGRSLGPKAEVEFAFLQAGAWLAKTNAAQAEAILHPLLASHSDDRTFLSRAAGLFAEHDSYSNALRFADQRLQLTPDDLFALTHKGTLSLLAGDFSNAVPPLTRALSRTNSYPARLNRAFAYFQTGRFDEAEADYRALLEAFPHDHQAWKGLAEIACQRRDTNAAIGYYQQCLSRTVAGSPEAKAVAERLKVLQQAGH
jgi:tetratricopeptide (TPR) repeat protein